MTLGMDVAKFVPGDCHNVWKRDDGERGSMIDDEELKETVFQKIMPW